ncbi:MAG: tetratricopeptide repeat protein [Alphaproteobacteria bacterium]|nr:tetratricopeptide repeat protein [Alphaproteobacteria bacterium]
MAKRVDPDTLVERGLRREEKGDVAGAEALYRQALAKRRDHAGAHTQLGGLLAQSSRFDDALPHLQAAAALLPEDPSILNNLGHTYRELGQLPSARDVFAALAAREPSVHALYGLGVVHQQLGELEPARSALQRALEHDAGFYPARSALAAVEELLGRPDRAIQELTRILADHGPLAKVRCRLGVLQVLYGNATVGAAMLAGALVDDPDDAIATHMLASVRGDGAARPPDRFVADLFDAFAEGYDHHLADVLETRVPALVAAIPGLGGSVLDLGCGTGMAVRALGDRVERAVGVDLSPRMVAIARSSGLYASVSCAGIEEWLAQDPGSFDTVLAADVLVYVGALESLFAAVRPVCAGAFVFTTETLEGEGFRLLPSGRYAHAERYVRDAAAAAGFAVASSDAAPLRKERGDWIQGRIWVLRPA